MSTTIQATRMQIFERKHNEIIAQLDELSTCIKQYKGTRESDTPLEKAQTTIHEIQWGIAGLDLVGLIRRAEQAQYGHLESDNANT